MNETKFRILIQPPAGGGKSANAFCVMGDTFAGSSSGRISIYEMKDCSAHEQPLLKNC